MLLPVCTGPHWVDRCDPCRADFDEGDWFCRHLAERHGHTIARLDDREVLASTA
jgi:hypothetical protein